MHVSTASGFRANSARNGLYWLILGILHCAPLYAQNAPDVQSGQPAAIDDTIEAGQSEAEKPARRLVSFNEYEGRHFSINVGFGFLLDYAAYAQDDNSKKQIALDPDGTLRDARVLFRGRLNFLKRPVTWSSGIMYNGPTHSWQFRQTGFMVAVPEIWGHIFVGRTKEGISLNKIMVGYSGWTSERATMNDAALPILADGIKWLGYSPKLNLVWNAGVFGDWLSQGLAFSTYRRQFVGRAAYVKLFSGVGGKLLHAGAGLRYGNPNNDSIRLRSRPEVFPAPYFIDTGGVAAKNTKMIVPETYYRDGPFLYGFEYMVQKADASDARDPYFHGGEVFASWIATGETRTYNIRGGYFNAVSPSRPVFQGGPGAWELVTRFSYTDLDSGAVKGGRFWRITPMVNWHMSDNVRLEITYGYGALQRFELLGHTQFFQTRIQFTL